MLSRLESNLLFLTLLFLPTQIGRHFWPDFSYIFSLKIDYLSPTLYLWDILAVGLLGIWLLQRPTINLWGLKLLGIFLFSQIFSLIGVAEKGTGLVRLEQYLIAGGFGLYVASQNFSIFRSKLYLPLGLSMFLQSLLAVSQFVFAKTLGFWILGERTFSISTPGIAKFDFYGREFLRPYASLPHPNVLAAFLLVTSILFQLKLGVSKRWKLFLTLSSALVIFLTVSRVAIMAGSLSLFYFLSNKWLKIFGIVLVVLSPILYSRFSSILNFDSLTLLRREELSEVALRIFTQSPILGVGLNNFIPTISNDPTVGPSRFLQPVHNIYLLSLSETGLLGFGGFLSLIMIPLWLLYKATKLDREAQILTLAWFVVLFLGLFDHFFLTLPQGYRLLFLVWGLTLAFLSEKRLK